MLKQLKISGFKSFARPSAFEFSSAITAIVGPNGSGKCVTGDTLVQLSSGERRPIKELFDSAHATARAVEQYDDGVAVRDSGAPAEVLALDLSTQRVESRFVSAFVRRTAPATLLDIQTRSGRRITTTPYHPLFVLDGGAVRAARADALAVGTRIAAPRRIPVTASLQKLSMFSVLAAFRKEDMIYVPYSRTLAALLEKKTSTRSAVVVARTHGLAPEVVQRFWDGQALPFSAAVSLFAGEDESEVFSARQLKSRTWGFIKIPEAVDEDLARFLGYVISEGRNCKNGQIRFVNDDVALVEDFAACAMRHFGVSATLRSYKGRGIIDAFISSMTLSRLLDRVFGITQDGHSRIKRVPAQIFASPDAVIAAFLSALFEGDGHFHVPSARSRGAYVEYASASEQLARDVHDLLLRFGIAAVIRKKMKRATNGTGEPRAYWSVFIYGTTQMKTLAASLMLRGRKKEALQQLASSEARENPNADFIPGGAALVRAAVKAAGVKVKPLRREYPTLAAYCELRCEATRPGIMRCVEAIERYGSPTRESQKLVVQLRTLVSADVLWDEILSVQEVEGEGYVYDLCVDGDHNFIGNSIVAHNSNVAEAFRFALGEQSIKSLRGKRGEDLIWSGSKTVPRGNRASVSITFDNRSRFLDLDFDEVAVERVVHRDGVNDYLLNGSQVRLKDLSELLAGANIGETGHHIISQGEADRILSANPRERRGMIEESLGLKVFQYKKEESQRKLEKTKENIKQVMALRREVAPHLAFLKRQMEKIEKTETLRDEFREAVRDYLKRESDYLSREKARLSREKEGPAAQLARVRKNVSAARAALEKRGADDEHARELATLGRSLEDAREKKERLTREIGKLEGQIAFAEAAAGESDGTPVPRKEVEAFVREAERRLGEANALMDAAALIALVRALVERAKSLLTGEANARAADISKLKSSLDGLSKEFGRASEEEARLVAAHESVRARIEAKKDESHELEKSVFSLMREEQELMHRLGSLESELARLALVEDEFARDVAEAKALAGEPLAYESVAAASEEHEPREAQEKRKRSLEKMKIRLEESGAADDAEVRREYQEVSEREAFLEKELADLEVSAAKLAELIVELDGQIDERFAKGLSAINAEFGRLFAVMFDGGTASLSRVKERKVRRGGIELSLEDGEEPPEDESGEEVVEGIEVQVSLPRKRIKGLVMLSGGERALTSIALIFAMASVNPPPFLVLDETDAALDEANSRRYGDMLETLAAKSQLIVITHNRETMSRAGVLYGVTMGAEGVSKVLSVKFEEAVAVAK